MPHPKIATCCYCGTRAALVLRGETRHELSCSACGAPLHDLKAMKSEPRTPARPHPQGRGGTDVQRKPGKWKKKKRKPMSRRILGEALDLIEDIFD